VLSNVTYCSDAYEAATDADALVLVTEWEEFRALDLERLKDIMACPAIVDLRNVYRAEEMARHGFFYDDVGRGRKPARAGMESPPLDPRAQPQHVAAK
jgi:UDPglucose 6-dehydrogenase